MLYQDIIRMAMGSLGTNKLRSFLTMSGITIGVFSVIGVMTTVSALRGSIETGLSFLGSSMFQFGKWPTGPQAGGNNSTKYEQRRNITLDEGQRYIQLMEPYTSVVCLKVFNNDGASQAVYGGRKTEPNLTYGGSNQHFLAANQYTIDEGRNLTPEDVDLGRPVILIGSDIVHTLFPAESPLNRMIKVNAHAYTVVGTFASRGTAFGQSQDDIAIVPITRFLSDNGARKFTVNIATQSPSQEVYNETMDHAITAMRIVRRLRPEDENDFELYSNDSLVAAFASVADAVAAGSFVISGIALLAAGVGIMNIMLVSVTERTKEIGIRKSIGARKVSILTQFLIEAVTISLVGGLFGILLGVGAGNGLAIMMNASVIFPWMWAAIGLLVCSAIGIGFGFYPAWKASSLDPIEALRYE